MTVDPKYKVHMDDIVASGTAVENKDAQDEALNEMVSTMSWEQDSQFNHGYVAVAGKHERIRPRKRFPVGQLLRF